MKIVALGDSLTVGETGFTPLASEEAVTPYPECVERLAEEYLRGRKGDLKVDVLNKGVNGDLTSGMLERFPRDVVAEKPDYVIILGGANDIGWGLEVARIAHNLTSMYDSGQNERIGTVACGVPSILGCDELITPRLELNRTIASEAAKRKIPYLDLFLATADQNNKRLLEAYSADGLHLNAKGYERMGDCVFEKWLKTILEQLVFSGLHSSG
jgi:lysophospholipase L1-like esterase